MSTTEAGEAQPEVMSFGDLILQLTGKAKEFWDGKGQEIMSGLDSITDEKRRIEIAQAIFQIAESDALESGDIAHLVSSFEYASSHDPQTGKEYGVKDSISGWRTVTGGDGGVHAVITLHDKIVELEQDKAKRIGTTHFIAHELSHTIVKKAEVEGQHEGFEVDDEFHDDLEPGKQGENLNDLLDTIRKVLNNTEDFPPEAESEYLYLLHLNGNPLFEKERLVDMLGTFIASGRDRDDFVYRRLKMINTHNIGEYFNIKPGEDVPAGHHELATDKGTALTEHLLQLFDTIDSVWPDIMSKVREIKLDAHDPEEVYDEPELPFQKGTLETATTTSQEGTSISTQPTTGNPESNMNQRSSYSHPGQQPNYTSSATSGLWGFIAAFADAVDPKIENSVGATS